jgi:antitoxin MazE
MSTILQTQIIKIGNSQGIRIPKLLLSRAGLSDMVEVEACGDQLIIRPTAKKSRIGWEGAFQQMAANGDDRLLDTSQATSWDEAEWQW